METCDFDFELPPHLTAQYPCEKRGQSRLMTIDRRTGNKTHGNIRQFPDILERECFLGAAGEKPLLVFNDTKVRKARLMGKCEETGAQVEFLLLENTENGNWKTLVSRAKRRKLGQCFLFFDDKSPLGGAEIASAKITKIENEYCFLEFNVPVNDEWLEKYGHVPLPPYIKRDDTQEDSDRYQTVYAKQTGAAAAPTAGLHFTEEILSSLNEKGFESIFITLHVGLGTFLPVRSGRIEDHVMHEEQFFISSENAALIEKAIAQKRMIVSVGTTSLRAIESAAVYSDENGVSIRSGRQSTSIFIYPGYKFRAVNALFTNFHTPKSTLLMLVSAFASRELILESYAEAVRKEYRFFSYGDAMFIY